MDLWLRDKVSQPEEPSQEAAGRLLVTSSIHDCLAVTMGMQGTHTPRVMLCCTYLSSDASAGCGPLPSTGSGNAGGTSSSSNNSSCVVFYREERLPGILHQ